MIEEAGAIHTGVLAAIHRASFARAEAWGETAMAALLAGAGCSALIDQRGGCALARVMGHDAELLTLAVSPPVRRIGVGRGLLLTVMERAARAGARVMFLEVAKENTPAIALYS